MARSTASITKKVSQSTYNPLGSSISKASTSATNYPTASSTSNSSTGNKYTYSDGFTSAISPQARQQAQALLPYNQPSYNFSQPITSGTNAQLQQNYINQLNQLQSQYANQPLTTQVYEQQFQPTQTGLNVNKATLTQPNTQTLNQVNTQATVQPTYTTNLLGKTIQNEPWVLPNTGTMGGTTSTTAGIYNQTNQTLSNVSPTNQATNINSAIPNQSEIKTDKISAKPQKFFDGSNIVELNDTNKEELFNRAYGNQTDISGKIVRLGNNQEKQSTGDWKPTSPEEMLARQELYNTGGLGNAENWKNIMKENPQAGQDAWAWWMNDPTLRSDGGVNIKEVSKLTKEEDISKIPVDDKLPQIGLNSPETKNVLNNSNDLLNSYKEELGVDTGAGNTNWIKMAFDAINKKVEAVSEVQQAEVKSAKEQILLNTTRKDELAKEFALDRQSILNMFNNQQENLRQQKVDLENKTRKQKESELGAIAVSQAMRGVSLATTSYARQEMSNMVNNMNREYSIANDRLNLQQAEIRVATIDKINQLEKNKADIMFQYENKISDLQYKIDLSLPKTKELLADMQYKVVGELQGIETKQQEYRIKEQDYLLKLDEYRNKLTTDKFNKAVDLSEKFGKAVGLADWGIPDGTPIYTKPTGTINNMTNITQEVKKISSDLEQISPAISSMFKGTIGSFIPETKEQKSLYTNAIFSANKLINVINDKNITDYEKDLYKIETVGNLATLRMPEDLQKEQTTDISYVQKRNSANQAIQEFKNVLINNGYNPNETQKWLGNIYEASTGDAEGMWESIITNIKRTMTAKGEYETLSEAEKREVNALEGMANMYSKLENIFTTIRLKNYGTALTNTEATFAQSLLPSTSKGAVKSLSTIEMQNNNFFNNISNSINNRTGNYSILPDRNINYAKAYQELSYKNENIGTNEMNTEMNANANANANANTNTSFNQSVKDNKLNEVEKNLTSDNSDSRNTFEKKYLSKKSSMIDYLLPNAKADDSNINTEIRKEISSIPNGEKSGMWCGSFVNNVLKLPSGKRFGDSLNQKKGLINIDVNDINSYSLSSGFAFVSNPYPNLKLTSGKDKGKTIGHVGLIESIDLYGRVTILDSNFKGDKRIRRITYDSYDDFIKNEKVEGFYDPYKK